MATSVRFLNGLDRADDELLDAGLRCLERLFPDSATRPAPEMFRTWLAESSSRARNTPWREVFGVLLSGAEVIGIAVFSGHLHRRVCFGGYFGVLPGRRRYGCARRFFDEVVAGMRGQVGRLHGILFEVDPVDESFLEQVAARDTLLGQGDESRIERNIRALRRLLLYTRSGALAAVQPDGTLMPYWQPVVHALPERLQRQCLLCLSLGEAEPVTVSEAVDFVYDDLYLDAYGGNASDVLVPDFKDYLGRLKQAVAPHAALARFTRLRLPPVIRRLCRRAVAEGFDTGL